MKKIILLSIIAILLGISDTEAQPTNKTYEDMKSGFRLSYPNTWQQTQTAPGAVFSILKKDKSAGISVNLTDFVGNKDKMIKEMETEKSQNSFISELRQRHITSATDRSMAQLNGFTICSIVSSSKDR